MISQTAEYALRSIVYLADQDEPQTNAQIAKVTEIPVGYLAKVMQILSRTKLVNARRGLRGGFTLAYEPTDVTVLEVVNAVDPVRRFHECPLGLHGMHLCPLHCRLDEASKAVEETFGDTTISDLLDAPKHRKPLCRFPNVVEPA
ncbi:MAG: Rrf2 family transcriptional regulator [Pirellulaceae bacterium]|jgi:Rrf2 family protein|nr:Rrf2 family transcriptional regulator [Pirellulaceae bacterium]